jgi:hypothetical protein
VRDQEAGGFLLLMLLILMTMMMMLQGKIAKFWHGREIFDVFASRHGFFLGAWARATRPETSPNWGGPGSTPKCQRPGVYRL